MRLAFAAALLLAILPASASARPWFPHVRAARAYADERAGTVRVSVRARGHAWGWGERDRVPSASVLKAMLLVAYLNDPRVRDRALTAADRALLDPMVRRSDDPAANAVVGFVGAAAVTAVAHRAGMRDFALALPIWGNSLVTADDQTRFLRWIDRRMPARHRRYGMRLLATVVPAQRWGIGQERPRGWALYFKGGWGSGSGAVDHQVVLLRRGARRIAVAVMTTGSPSHAYAIETLRGTFARLLRGLAVRRQRSASSASARRDSRSSTARNARTTLASN